MNDLNINSKKWQKKYSEDRGYGSDESKTMADTGDYTTTGGSVRGQHLSAQGRTATRSSGRQPVRRPSRPSPSPATPVPPSRKP